MSEKKTYQIDGMIFTMKDLTLDEADDVSRLIKISDESAQIDNEDSKRFLKIVLAPAKTPEREVDFGKTTESTALEVLKDFFTGRIQSAESLKTFFGSLTRKPA